jgi:hypothetical protein
MMYKPGLIKLHTLMTTGIELIASLHLTKISNIILFPALP